jgi:hypothetical protein
LVYVLCGSLIVLSKQFEMLPKWYENLQTICGLQYQLSCPKNFRLFCTTCVLLALNKRFDETWYHYSYHFNGWCENFTVVLYNHCQFYVALSSEGFRHIHGSFCYDLTFISFLYPMIYLHQKRLYLLQSLVKRKQFFDLWHMCEIQYQRWCFEAFTAYFVFYLNSNKCFPRSYI